MLSPNILAKQAGMSLRGYQLTQKAKQAELREAEAAAIARIRKAENEQQAIAALVIPYNEQYELRARREHERLYWRVVLRKNGHTIGEVHHSTIPDLVAADLTEQLAVRSHGSLCGRAFPSPTLPHNDGDTI